MFKLLFVYEWGDSPTSERIVLILENMFTSVSNSPSKTKSDYIKRKLFDIPEQ